jgi:hypothetical protein
MTYRQRRIHRLFTSEEGIQILWSPRERTRTAAAADREDLTSPVRAEKTARRAEAAVPRSLSRRQSVALSV